MQRQQTRTTVDGQTVFWDTRCRENPNSHSIDELEDTIDQLRSELGNTRRSRTRLRLSTIHNKEAKEIEAHAKELYKSILNAWISSPVTGRPTLVPLL